MLSISALVRLLFDKKASELYLTQNAPPALRVDGKLTFMEEEKLTATDCETLIYTVITDLQQKELEKKKELIVSFGLEKVGRVRMHIFSQKGTWAASLRAIPEEIADFNTLGLPVNIEEIVRFKKGLFLITGPTGAGKTTTLAAIIDWFNKNRSWHIVTLESILEHIHINEKSIINQREIDTDVKLQPCHWDENLLSNPDVLVIDSIKTGEQIKVALNIAEAGHLVLAVMDTYDSLHTLNRIIDYFSLEQRPNIRKQLANTLQVILSQQLLPRGYSSGRVLACEILMINLAIRNFISQEKFPEIYSLMQKDNEYGMQTMNQSLAELYQQQIVTHNEIMDRTSDTQELTKLIKGEN